MNELKVNLILLMAWIGSSSAQMCQNNQISYGGSCWKTCPNNTAFIFKDGSYTCQQCDLTRYLVYHEEIGACACAQKTYIHPKTQQCAPCHYTCVTCKGPDYDDCVTCDTNLQDTRRLFIGGACLCKIGYYDNTTFESVKCFPCHRDCQTCNGTEDYQCIKCAAGKVRDQFGHCVCPNGFIPSQQGPCICPPPLATDINGQCNNPINSCGYNQQPSRPSNIANAGKGSKGPKGPKGKESKQDCACLPGLVKIKGKCSTCSQNQVHNPKNGKCQCPKNGTKVKKKCIICLEGQVYNKKTEECGCKKNQFMTQTKSCIRCPPKTIYQGGQCSCIFNYYMEFNGRCRKCNKKSDHPACAQVLHGKDKPRQLQINEITQQNI